AKLLVVEAAMRERLEREIEAEAPVQVRERVAVEGRGDAERVVVGGVEHGLRFLRIHADEESAAGARGAIVVDLREEFACLARREVDDARAGIEKSSGARVVHIVQIVTAREISVEAGNFDV